MASKTWMGWGLAIAGVVAAGPLVLGRGDPKLASAHEEIARMTEVEQAVLMRRYDEYKALPEEKRARYRALHQSIEADRVNGAQDAKALNDYCDWLKTIDSWQQDELAHLDDPEQKAKRVAEIVAKRREKALAADSPTDDSPPDGKHPFQLPVLTEDQLTKVFDVLAERLDPEVRARAADLKGLKRFGVQVKLLKEKVNDPKRIFQTISQAELTQLVEASGNAELKSQLTLLKDHTDKKRRAIRAIFTSTHALFLRESASAKDEALEAFFNTLSDENQDSLLVLSASEFKTQLRLRQLESDPDVSELEHLMGDQFSAAKRRMEKFGRGGPNGPGRPFRGPAGEGRRPPPGEGDRKSVV